MATVVEMEPHQPHAPGELSILYLEVRSGRWRLQQAPRSKRRLTFSHCRVKSRSQVTPKVPSASSCRDDMKVFDHLASSRPLGVLGRRESCSRLSRRCVPWTCESPFRHHLPATGYRHQDRRPLNAASAVVSEILRGDSASRPGRSRVLRGGFATKQSREDQSDKEP